MVINEKSCRTRGEYHLQGPSDEVYEAYESLIEATKAVNLKPPILDMFFTKSKDRVRDFRGLKALCAPIIMAGLTIQHNFIEPHCNKNEFPCNLAGVNSGLGENRWLNLIRLSAK